MKPIHILHLEDDPRDVELIKSQIDKDGIDYTIQIVDTAESFTEALKEREPDIILADYNLPAFHGSSALKIVREKSTSIPFIIVSGAVGEDLAVESLKSGATDYVSKNNLTRLVPAVKRALHEKNELLKQIDTEKELLRLNAAIEHSSDAIVTTDLYDIITYVNPAFENMTGYLKEEILGKKDSLLQSAEHENISYKDLLETIINGGAWQGILTSKKKDGSLFAADSTISPIYDSNDKLTGFVAIQRDITQALEIETQRNRDQLIRRRLADIFLAYADDEMYDKVLQLVLVNLQSTMGLFGYVDENADLVTPSLTADIWNTCNVPGKNFTFPHNILSGRWAQALQEKKTFFINEGLAPPDGHMQIPNALFSPIVYQDKVIGLLAIAHKKADYTDDDKTFLEGICEYIAPIMHARLQRDRQNKKRRQAEEQLRNYSSNLESMVAERTQKLDMALKEAQKARERIHTIIQSLESGLLVIDLSGSIIMMNQYAENLLNVDFSEKSGISIDQIFDDNSLWPKIQENLEEENIYQFDFSLHDDISKNLKVIRTRASEIYNEENVRTGYIMLFNDYTQENKIDRLKTDFISTVAHEFRTPLTSIQGFSEIMLTKENLKPEERKRFLTYINSQAISLAAIVNDLLNISRIEAGTEFPLNKTPCEMNAVINQVIPLFQEQAAKNHFEVVLPEKPEVVLCDKVKITQVLKNIISNAVKYSPDGGVIRITGETAGECYRVTVEDNGVGMTPDQVAKIFEKFYRANFTDSAVEGSGLGMTIVKYIVEAHGGRVFVESEPGKGTKVMYEIPKNIPLI